jgi:hypothetical protein
MALKKKIEPPEKKSDKSVVRKSASNEAIRGVVEQKLNEFGVVLRDEFERQVFQANAEIRTFIIDESRARKRWLRVIFILLGLIVILIGCTAYLIVNSTQKNMQTALTKGLSEFELRSQQQTSSLLNPMRENVEQNLNNVTSQLALSRSYIDVYALEGLARAGSRSAFEDMNVIVKRGGEKSKFAQMKIGEIKFIYSILAEPKKQNLTLGEVNVTRAGKVLIADSLSDMELLYVMNSPNATLPQTHHIMTLLWNRDLDKDMENEYWSILQNSRNLPASIAVCSILRNKFGKSPGDIFEFSKWKSFLESRM